MMPATAKVRPNLLDAGSILGRSPYHHMQLTSAAELNSDECGTPTAVQWNVG